MGGKKPQRLSLVPQQRSRPARLGGVCWQVFSTPAHNQAVTVPKSQSEKLDQTNNNLPKQGALMTSLIVHSEYQAGVLIKHRLFEHVLMLTYKHGLVALGESRSSNKQWN